MNRKKVFPVTLGIGLGSYYVYMNINCVKTNMDLFLYLSLYVFILFVPIIIGMCFEDKKKVEGKRNADG